MIDVGLRHPLSVHQIFADVLRFRQVEREAVAIVVVARVLLVQPRQPRCFVLRADVLHVPVRNHLRAVRVDRRHDDADHVVEHALRFFIGARQAVVDELRCRLRRRDFARVQREGLDDDRLCLRYDLLSRRPRTGREGRRAAR